jgi:hypothetical protein
MHRAIAEVLAADPYCGEHEGKGARRQYVRQTNVSGTSDAVGASPRPLRAIALIKGDRVA